MADPLSVAAGVVGLLTAAAQVSKILHGVITKARHAPEETKRIKTQVDDIRNILGSLQLYLNGAQRASKSRTSLIMVDQVVATVASCVTTFSELDTFAVTLESEVDMGILDRLRWSSKDKDIQAVLVRLESHKSSLQLMLTILSCQSQIDAESRVDRLCDLVEQMLSQNITLKNRLVALEITDNSPNLGLTMDSKIYSSAVPDPQTPLITSPDSAVAVDDLPHWQRNDKGFAFDEMLMNSRAYRVVGNHNSDAFSIVSSAGRTASWSMLSGLSLSEVSHIGIQAIPIYASDITNKDHYDFNPSVGMTARWTAPSPAQENVTKPSRRSWLKVLLRGPRIDPAVTDEEASPLVFGVPLRESIQYANVAITVRDVDDNPYVYGYIPVAIAKTGIFLKEKATRAEDIFAMNGNPVRLNTLQRAFDSPPRYGKGLVMDQFTVHDAASMFLRYLKMLPEPLVPYDKYDTFINHLEPFTERDLDAEESSKAVDVIQGLITDLPPLNRQLLLYVLDMIGVFAAKSDENNMTALRLVSCFQPAILANVPSMMDADAHHVAAQVALVMALFENELVQTMRKKDDDDKKDE